MKTILVVDDHATNRELLRTLLEYGGYGVLEAADGADGLVQVRSRNPALVIADILMPTMDGYEFVRRLREDPAVSDTRVIFYTATYLEREAARLAEMCGVSCVLTKPCEPDVVLRTVARVIDAPLGPTPILESSQPFEREHLRVVTDKLSGVADDLFRASERFAALLDIGLHLASERDPHQLLEKVCQAARGLIGAKYAFLAVGKRDAAETEFFAIAGMDTAHSSRLERPSLRLGDVGMAVSERKSIRMVNAGGDPRKVGLPAGYPAVNSLLVAPVTSLKYVYGWICLINPIGAAEFGEEDERLLSILGAQVGRIYENGSLYQEVLRKEEGFRRLFEQASDGIFIFSMDHRFLDANQRGLEMLRCTKAELLRLGVADFVVPEQRHRLMREPVGIPPGQTYLAEWTHLRRDGSTFPAEVSARRLNDESILAIVRDLTERRRAESALREREKQLRLAMDAAHLGMFDWDMIDGTVTWSARHEEMFGFAPGEFDGTFAAFMRHLHPDDVAGINAEIAHCIAAHRHFDREFRVVWRDGSVHWMEGRGEFAYSPEGKPLRMHGVVVETTARRLADEELRLFRMLVDQSNDAIEIIDPATGRFLDVNEKACQDLGRSRDEMRTMCVSDIDPTVPRSSWDEQMRELRERKFRILEGMHQRKDGTSFPVEISTKWIHVGKDYVLANVRDISERKRHEEELRESERRFRSLLSNMDLVSMMLDTQARITYCNDFLLHLTGWHREELVGRDWFDVFIPPDDHEIKNVFSALLHDLPSAWHHENNILTRSGERRLIRWNSTVLRSVSGDVIGTASIGADITDQRQAENGLRRLNRIYAVLSGINALIVRERDRQCLFDEACRVAVDDGKFGLVWIGSVDNEAQRIRPVALRGPERDRSLVTGASFNMEEGGEEGKGTMGEAARTLQPVYRNDLSVNEDLHPVTRELFVRGYNSVISLPLVIQGACAAVMVLYSREAGLFDREELNLLSELASDLSFALEYAEKEERVNFLAFHDPLTGLANRTQLHARLTQALADARNESQSCALVLMNINNFHHINNTLGQQNGDLLLKQIAGKVQRSVWDTDMVACLGGDEFAILLSRLGSSEDIEVVVGKVSAALRGAFTVAGLPISLEARMGYAIYPEHADNADLLWQRAGVAVRAAKELHLPTLNYDRRIDHYDPQRLALISGLQKAIDADELVLHYQPKMDLQKQRVIGVEVLLRWQHPEKGLLFPDAFIPLVENTGLINPMTMWVLANAMRQARIWDRSGIHLDIAVNLSVRNLQNPNLISEILDLARSSRFPLNRLTLEITESAIMVDPERGKSMLTRLHEAGISFSMDDFGIGQSSLGYLKDLPITQLKIDKSFVIGIA